MLFMSCHPGTILSCNSITSKKLCNFLHVYKFNKNLIKYYAKISSVVLKLKFYRKFVSRWNVLEYS